MPASTVESLLRGAAWLAVCLLIGSCWAKSAPPGNAYRLPVAEGLGWRFTHLSFGEGPSNDRIGCIVQDDLGLLWFGTQDGLKSYDGYHLREFRHDAENPKSLSGSYVNALLKDRAGMLWIASDSFLDRYNPATETFARYGAGWLNSQVGHIGQDSAGTIWLSTSQGLYGLDPASGRTVHYMQSALDPSSLSSNLVRSTLEGRDGSFWVANSKSIDLFDRRTGKVVRRFPLRAGGSRTGVRGPEPMIRLFEDHAGVVWVAFSSGVGLAVVDRPAGRLISYRGEAVPGGADDAAGALDAGVVAINEGRDGVLWLGTNGRGLLKLDHDRKRLVRFHNHPSDPESLSMDEVLALFQDKEGNFWIGTHGSGVDRINGQPSPFQQFRHDAGNPNSLDTNSVSSVFEDSQGILWVGTRNALNRIDRKTGRYSFYRQSGSPGSLSSSFVISIAEERAGTLWFGTGGAGLDRFDRHTGRFKAYRHDPANPHSLSHDTVLNLFVDHKGTLWAGTEDGLNAFDPKTDRFRVFKASATEQNRYRDIAEDKDGTLWLATWDAGLQHFDPATKRFTVYRHSAAASSLSSDEVDAVCVDRSGTVWAGTHSGLDRMDRESGNFTHFTEHDGLPNSNLTGILEDRRGDLWLSTNNGLSRFDPSERSFKNYSISDGLLGNEFYGYNTPWKSPRGEMFFGSHGGLTAFFPERVVDNPYIPPVVLTAFQILGKPVPIGGNSPLSRSISVTDALTLTYAQSIFAFEFAALSYISPARNHYRYRLEGLETQWNETSSDRRFVTYTTLRPGQYLFRVQGSNNRGLWNETGVAIRIAILPPWWSTWWFRALVALLALAVCAYSMQLLRIGQRNRRLLREKNLLRDLNLELDRRVAERTAELQREVDRRRSTESYLRIAATAFECQEGMAITNADHMILQINKAFAAITGYTAEEVVGANSTMLRSDPHAPAFDDGLMEELCNKGVWQGEIWHRRKNGEIFPVWLTFAAVRDPSGEVSHYVETLIDITERKVAEKFEHLAFYDSLTGLPNRRLLYDRLQQAQAASARNQQEGALLFIVLDNFKGLNDTLGHDIGDLLLQTVAQRLTACVREVDTVARLGGDEFVIVLNNLSKEPGDATAQVKAVGEDILASLSRPYTLGAHEYRSTASIGAALLGVHRKGIEDLLKQGDIAMYQAKAKGRNNFCFFDPELHEAIKARAAGSRFTERDRADVELHL